MGQGDPLRLGAVDALAELEVRAERSALEQHRFLRLGFEGNGDVADVALREGGGEVLAIEVARGDVGGQGRRQRLAVNGALDVRAVAAHPHDVGIPRVGAHRRDLAGVDALDALLDALDDPVAAEVEVMQVRRADALSGGDVVEDRLHAGGELGVDEAPELMLEEGGRREGREGRHELLALLAGVAARLDGVDDAGVRARSADAFALEQLHQRRVREARRRLRLVTRCREVDEVEDVALRQLRQGLVAVVERCVGVVGPFDVGPEEAGEHHGPATGAEREGRRAGYEARDGAGVCRRRLDAGRHEAQPRVRHLRGDGALPDEVVERGLDTLQPVLVRRLHLRAGRSDGFVRLLGVARCLLECALLTDEEPLAVPLDDGRAGGGDGLRGEVDRVRAHVRDVAVLVERLRDAHGVLGREAELAAGLLLERRRRERGGR